MKGQTQAVTAVLITGVIVAGVASAYVWGIPLIQKRQGQAQVQTLENSVLALENAIVSTANSGQGSSNQVTLDVGNGNVEFNASGNYIDINTYASGASYPIGSWRFLHGEDRQGLSIGSGKYGIRGENTPGVVVAKRRSKSSSLVTYRIEFRNLQVTTPSGSELKLIDLQRSGAAEATGEVQISFSNQGTETDTGSDAVVVERDDDGNVLTSYDRERTVMSVDLR